MSRATSSRRQTSVLIVDDDPDIAAALKDLLDRELKGTRVVTALGGAEALELMEEISVGLILTDYRMPQMDGFEFLGRARVLAPNVPAIMMTAYADPDLAPRALRDYRVGLVISKPFEIGYIVEVVRAAMRGEPLQSMRP